MSKLYKPIEAFLMAGAFLMILPTSVAALNGPAAEIPLTAAPSIFDANTYSGPAAEIPSAADPVTFDANTYSGPAAEIPSAVASSTFDANTFSGPGAETPLTAAAATSGANSGYSVQLRYIPGLGNILVGDDGMTLYAFLKDSPGVSTCTGGCETLWPAEQLNIGIAPQAGPGVTAKVDIVAVSDETAVLTINGLPVYNYSMDLTPGDVLGQGFKGNWYVMSSSGALIKVSSGLMGPGAETPVP